MEEAATTSVRFVFLCLFYSLFRPNKAREGSEKGDNNPLRHQEAESGGDYFNKLIFPWPKRARLELVKSNAYVEFQD